MRIPISFTASALLAASFSAWPAEARQVPATYPHAFAHADCAPWDGPAVTIVLQRDPMAAMPAKGQMPTYRYPLILVRLYMRDIPFQQWFPLPGANGNMEAGHIMDCPAQGKCEDRPGRVRFDLRTKDLLKGEIRCLPSTPYGRETVFPFSAPVLPVRVLCG